VKHIPAAMIFVGLMLLAVVAFGQDHHPLHKDFYHKWRAPDNPDVSCCNARMPGAFGGEIGDCEPTQARVVNGQWQAWVRQQGIWIPIPEAKILREKNPNIFDGHLCWTPDRGVICFVPPNVGG
jgi:hypothetical protein